MLQILEEDQSIIVVIKAPGQPAVDDLSGEISLLAEIKDYLKKKSKGVPYVAAIHRLDRPVGGIMVFAKTKNAAAVLSESLQAHQFTKKYYAVIQGSLAEKSGKLEHYLIKNHNNLSQVVHKNHQNAKYACLKYEVKDEKEGQSLLEIQLETGRHHQIRVQLSAIGNPIVNDRKYGDKFQRGLTQIGLFSYALEFKHPKSDCTMSYITVPTHAPFAVFFQ